MSRGAGIARWSAVILAAVLLGCFAAADRAADPSLPAAATALVVLALLTPCAVGAVVLASRPGHAVGRVMLLGPLPVALLAAADAYARIGAGGTDAPPGHAVAGILSEGLWPAFYAWPLAVALLFPDGRLPSPRWRAPAAAAFAASGLVAAGVLLGEERLPADLGGGPNPLHVPAATALEPAFWAAWGVMAAGLLAGAAAVAWRYRRASGVARLQLQWLAWSASLIPLGLLVCVASYALAGRVVVAVPIVLLLAGAAVSVSVGIAITRHGLYEIGRVVNRTLVYASLTVVLGLAFAAVAMASGLALGRGSPAGTAAATLAAALAFRPARDRIQTFVDRRFSRARYEGLRRMALFGDALRRGTAAPEDVEAALGEALRDPGLRVWLRLPGGAAYVDAAGRPAGDGDGRRARTRVVAHGGEIGVVEHDPRLRGSPDLLRSVLDAAALPMEIARLRAEVRARLTEVEASRERLLAAADHERRRLERDLHDGAQQRLVGLGVALRRIERSLPSAARVLQPALDRAVGEVTLAIQDLRTIAAGLRPPRLDDGLASALGDLARGAPIPVTVHVDARDVPAPLEMAAYYTVCEAVTNAVKHAAASRVRVEAVRRDGLLRLSVADDGAGGAAVGAGTGLAGIADRLAAHGGRLRIDSPPGAGTLLEAEIPCGS